MSRSYKKVFGWTVHSRGESEKRLANQKVRRTADVPNGNAYRKVYESYSICDQKCLYYNWLQLLNSEQHKKWWHDLWGIPRLYQFQPWKAWCK